MVSGQRRLIGLVRRAVAVLCFAAAALIVIRAGLPDRAAYEGVNVAGARVAPLAGNAAPPLTGFTLGGQPFTLTAYAGRPVLVNFWASWCEPCAAELPALQALAQRGHVVIGVNVGEAAAIAAAWLADRGVTFPNVADPDGRLAFSYRVRGLPATFVIDERSIIRRTVYGPVLTLSDLERLLLP